MTKTTRFIIRKCIGIVALLLGIHFMVAYQAKEFPFGLQVSFAINGVWSSLGWFISLIVIGYGVMQLFSGIINICYRKLQRTRGN